jgi:hypothetical protein
LESFWSITSKQENYGVYKMEAKCYSQIKEFVKCKLSYRWRWFATQVKMLSCIETGAGNLLNWKTKAVPVF